MSPFYENNLIMLIVLLWTLPWKIYAVWTAVKNKHKGWFIALIILNTVAILEIIYIFFIAKKTWPEVKKAFLRAITPNKKGHKEE